eukprot:m.20694 g.20694  ORF g.20694 m.20694 type:complete len:220 (-) comp32209_c0_seq2:119-778(-)
MHLARQHVAHREHWIYPVAFAEHGAIFLSNGELLSSTARGIMRLTPPETPHPVLAWLEDYAARVQFDDYPIIDNRFFLFPNSNRVVAVTNHVEISVTYRAVPSGSDAPRRMLYAYSITMRLLQGASFPACRLTRRRWIFSDPGSRQGVHLVEGEGVIGLFPILSLNGEIFRYQSCTYGADGSTGTGQFFFVKLQEGGEAEEEFGVDIPSFTLRIPDFCH